MKLHRGNIVKKAFEASGYKKIKICDELKISRPTFDRYLEVADLEVEFILKVGKLINYDFSGEIPEVKTISDDSLGDLELKDLKDVSSVFELRKLVMLYKNKYFDTLEKYTSILEKKTPSRYSV